MCRDGLFVAYKAVVRSYDKETSLIIIPQKEFYAWLKKQKPKKVKTENKGFTMECFGFACTQDPTALKSITISENKFLSECPKCKSVLVKRLK